MERDEPPETLFDVPVRADSVTESRPSIGCSPPNVGTAPNPWSLSTTSRDIVALFCQCDSRRTNCQAQTQQVENRYSNAGETIDDRREGAST